MVRKKREAEQTGGKKGQKNTEIGAAREYNKRKQKQNI